MLADVHDFHCKTKDDIIHKIKSLEPDMILCVGDIIDDQSENDEATLKFLHSLTTISNVYMSLGNHEISYCKTHPEFLANVKNVGVQLLEEEFQDITIKNTTIRLGGMYNYAFGMTKGSIEKEDMHNNHTYQFLSSMTATDAYQIMMAHRPDSFMYHQAYQWDIDLVLSGHVHGGQVILPFIGGLFAPEQGWFPTVDFGQFHKGNMTMLVTRGLSSSQEHFPRFNNPGEIIQIILQPH